MKILVTGANGFLGSSVVKVIKDAGHEVYATARTSENNRIETDLSNINQIEKLLENVFPNAIINCAALANFGTNCLSKLFPVNTLAPAVMASWCKRNNAYFCQVSGSIVHGTNTELINYNTPISTNTDYGRSKWLAEQLIDASDVTASNIRFSGIYGDPGPEHLSLNRIIRAAKKGEIPTIFGKGMAHRNYIHVMDAAKVLLYCVDNSLTGIRWSAGAEPITIAEMMKSICEVYLPEVKPIFSAGQEASDQIIESSLDIPKGLGFKEALVAYK